MRKNHLHLDIEECENRNLMSGLAFPQPYYVAPVQASPPLVMPPVGQDPSLPPLVPDGSKPIVPLPTPIAPRENPNPGSPPPQWEPAGSPSIYMVPDGQDTPPNPTMVDGTLPLPGTPMQDPRLNTSQPAAPVAPPTVLPMPPAGIDTPIPAENRPSVYLNNGDIVPSAVPPEIDILAPYNPSDGLMRPVPTPDIFIPPPNGVIRPVPDYQPPPVHVPGVIDPFNPANPPINEPVRA